MKPSQLLSRPGAWIKGHEALDGNGIPCGAEPPDAVKFCLVGALIRCKSPTKDVNPFAAIHEAVKRLGYENMPSFNDSPNTTLEDVLIMLERAGL